MGFPTGYTELFLPKFLIHTLSFLAHLKNIIFTLLNSLGIFSFQNDVVLPPTMTRIPETPPVSAILIRQLLPVITYSCPDLHESCAVCLHEFKSGQDIRALRCRHVFHRGCVDRWMDYEQTTCPLCRTEFVPDDMQSEFHQRLWDATRWDLVVLSSIN